MTPGLQSVAAAVLDHNAHPVAGVAVTFPSDAGDDVDAIATAVRQTAARLTRRVSGRAATGR